MLFTLQCVVLETNYEHEVSHSLVGDALRENETKEL